MIMRYEQQVTILFQGDSITDCGRNRNDFFSLGSGYANRIAGHLGFTQAESRPLILNRGIGGDRVSDLYARWNEDAIYLQPRLLSILIGVNDAWRIMAGIPDGAADRFASAYRHVLDITKEYLPNTKLVLMEPFILKCGEVGEQWAEWKELMTGYQQTARALSEQYEALFIPLQQPFDNACLRAEAAYWLQDGVHPTAAGHELIANEWLAAVKHSGLLRA